MSRTPLISPWCRLRAARAAPADRPRRPTRLEHLDLDAQRARDLRQAVAEDADRAREQVVARAEHVRHRGLEAARSRNRPEQYLASAVPKSGFICVDDAVEDRFELGTPMIDHRLRGRVEHRLGDGHGARDEQQTLRHGPSGRAFVPTMLYSADDAVPRTPHPPDRIFVLRRLSEQSRLGRPGAGPASLASPDGPERAGRLRDQRRRRRLPISRRSGARPDGRLLHADRRRSVRFRPDRGDERAQRRLRDGRRRRSRRSTSRPSPIDKLDAACCAAILEGGAAIAREAGVAILGGHTVKDDEPKYGMAVTGTIRPDCNRQQLRSPARRSAASHQAARDGYPRDRAQARRDRRGRIGRRRSRR